MPNLGTIEAVERAKAYPFRQPECSYLFSHHREWLLEGHPDTWQLDLEDLTPVFGYGSNPSPVALTHKFASLPDVEIPVIAFDLKDYDAVYSSHVSAGYVAAVLNPSPGTILHGFMTYLNEEELDLMDSSESRGENYERRYLPQAAGSFEDGGTLEGVTTYVGLHGCLVLEGSTVAVDGTRASGRRFPTKPQAEVLGRVIEQIAPGTESDNFIARTIASREHRRTWTAALKESELHSPGGV
jgi:hypothetical protein